MSSQQKILINATQKDELRVAIIDENCRLIDLDIEQPASAQKKSNIYKGKISSVEPSLGAVFVDYGCEKHGFLPIKDISRESVPSGTDLSNDSDIRKALKVGQQLVIQVEKEERGNKGAALSTFLSLAGSYLVLMPNNPRGGGISRRIEGEEREQLKNTMSKLTVPDGMSIIARTAGISKSEKELQWDLDILLHYWYAIKEAAIEKPGPYLIHQESDVVIRAIRDYLRHDTSEIIIDEKETFERVNQYMERVRPNFTHHLKLYNNPLPLFTQFQIERQIEEAFQREVILPSGATLVFDHTEALVAIDINSARATKGSNIEETAFNTNLEAAQEIPRQLRIRDIGGLVMIDFIDMLSNSNQRAVEERIREHIKQDRARIQIGKISRFGVLEMSRQRINPSLNKSSQITCPSCHGRGTVRSVESLTLSILRLIEEQSIKAGSSQLHVQLPIDHATYLLNEKRQALHRIFEKTQTEVVIIPNPHLSTPHYHLKLVKDDHNKNIVSFKQVKIPKTESISKRRVKPSIPEAPAINQYLTNNSHTKHPRMKKTSGDSLIKRIWDTLFGVNEPVAPPPKAKHKTPAKRKPAQSGSPRRKKSAPHASSSRRSEGAKSKDTTKSSKPSSRRGNRGGRPNHDSNTTPQRKTQQGETTPQRSRSRTRQTGNKEHTGNKTERSAKTQPSKTSQTADRQSANNPSQDNNQRTARNKGAKTNVKNVEQLQPKSPGDAPTSQRESQPQTPTHVTKTNDNVQQVTQAKIDNKQNESKARTQPAPNKAAQARPEDYFKQNSTSPALKQIKTRKAATPAHSEEKVNNTEK